MIQSWKRNRELLCAVVDEIPNTDIAGWVSTKDLEHSFVILDHFNHSLSTFIKSSNTVGGKTTMPAKTVTRCGCSLRTNSVQTPKFEPPPRMAQNKSAFSDSLTVRAVPFAVTIVAYM